MLLSALSSFSQMLPGEFTVLLGAVVHAAPATPFGTQRDVFLATFGLSDNASLTGYDPRKQWCPWEAALQLLNSSLFLRRVAEYHAAVGVELYEFFDDDMRTAVQQFSAAHVIDASTPPMAAAPFTQPHLCSCAVRQDSSFVQALNTVRRVSTEWTRSK